MDGVVLILDVVVDLLDHVEVGELLRCEIKHYCFLLKATKRLCALSGEVKDISTYHCANQIKPPSTRYLSRYYMCVCFPKGEPCPYDGICHISKNIVD